MWWFGEGEHAVGAAVERFGDGPGEGADFVGPVEHVGLLRSRRCPHSAATRAVCQPYSSGLPWTCRDSRSRSATPAESASHKVMTALLTSLDRS